MKKNQITENWVPAVYIRPKDGSVLDFMGLYEVSSLGRVRSMDYHNTGKIKVLSQGTYENSSGAIYYMVTLCLNKKHYTLLTHRLVLSSFKLDDWFPNAVVDHINHRTSASCDNRLCNLRWVTQQQNVSTEHRKTLLSKVLTNHQSFSKRVRVTNFTTGETTIYPSAREAGRALGINPKLPAAYISKNKGYCKKRNLHFAYV